MEAERRERTKTRTKGKREKRRNRKKDLEEREIKEKYQMEKFIREQEDTRLRQEKIYLKNS